MRHSFAGYTHIPMMVTIQGALSPECWHNMTPSEQAEYIHVLVRAMDNAEGQPHLGGLGATILSMNKATAYNGRSSQGQESAEPWTVDPSISDYRSPTDTQLATDLYCFQHFAEKLLDVAGEANSASDICEPNKQTPQLYNRDGMLGVRTQSLLENYAKSNGKKLGPNTEIPSNSPIHDLASKLTTVRWKGLSEAEFNRDQGDTQTSIAPPSPASDVDPEIKQIYIDKGLPDLVGGTLPPIKDDKDKDIPFNKPNGESSNSESNMSTYLLLGSGVALLGLALWMNREEK